MRTLFAAPFGLGKLSAQSGMRKPPPFDRQRDEVYRIAGEALLNVFRHAEARRIELEIFDDERQLRLPIRDDGKGMETPPVGGVGRPGYWGLRGMRERTKLVTAKVAV